MFEVKPIYPSSDKAIFDYATKCMNRLIACAFTNAKPYVTVYEDNQDKTIFCFSVPKAGDFKLMKMAFGEEYGIRQKCSIEQVKDKFDREHIVSLRYISSKPYEISGIPYKPFQNMTISGQVMIIADDLRLGYKYMEYTATIGIICPHFDIKEQNNDEC